MKPIIKTTIAFLGLSALVILMTYLQVNHYQEELGSFVDMVSPYTRWFLFVIYFRWLYLEFKLSDAKRGNHDGK